jgi:hypothetical protein
MEKSQSSKTAMIFALTVAIDIKLACIFSHGFEKLSVLWQ